LARQAARAFVTSPDETSALARVEMVKNVFKSNYFQGTEPNFRNINIQINCSATPCLTLDSQVSVTATMNSADGFHTYSSNATEIVDKWRNSN
jgi:Flp pilus assembly protein TadG